MQFPSPPLPRTQRAAKALARLGPSAALILLARHGETDWNREHRLQGQDPRVPGVNETGRRQAQAVRDAWGDRVSVTGCLPGQDPRVPGVNENGIDILSPIPSPYPSLYTAGGTLQLRSCRRPPPGCRILL